jgi:hypothetical protein
MARKTPHERLEDAVRELLDAEDSRLFHNDRTRFNEIKERVRLSLIAIDVERAHARQSGTRETQNPTTGEGPETPRRSHEGGGIVSVMRLSTPETSGISCSRAA